MLSRRLFRQLTDSLLLESTCRPVASACFASTCATRDFRQPRNVPSSRRSSSSSTKWKSRQGRDFFSKEAKVQGLKSRAAFKLLEVAANRTAPDGRVIGIDLIPAQPPRGVSTIQGDFLSPVIQDEVRAYVRDPELGRLRRQVSAKADEGVTEEELDDMERGYIDIERQAHLDGAELEPIGRLAEGSDADQEDLSRLSLKERDARQGRAVDVVLSDMSEPWDQTAGFYKKSLSDPYSRLMNTSGNAFRDHAGSMDLCMAAMTFAFDTLKTGGHFLCKYYKGSEEKAFETKLKRLFAKVYREKPESSRAVRLVARLTFFTDWLQESREAYFVALRRKEMPTKEEVFQE
ncbi:hypothetical protein IG631_10096 [Alternaria alternata]|nr:hypothetical protein IG631_10096 [Alternaria alternata]